MDNRAVVSVVLIFLNAEKFIEEAIESVFAQTYSAWELLLVDDGSSDESATIAQDYAGRHPERVRYLEHPGHANRGMSAARNLGIARSQGQFISFLDADDAWFPTTLEEQVAILESHREAAMVYGPIQYWYSWTGKPADYHRDYVEELGVPPDVLVKPPVLLTLYLQDRAAVPSGLLVRREVTQAIGGFEEAFRGEYEDQVFCAKVCLKWPVFPSSRCWYRYRQHADSCVAAGLRSGETHAARRSFLDWLTKYLLEQGVEDPAVWQAVRQELRPYRSAVRLFMRGLAPHELVHRVAQFGEGFGRN